MFITTLYFLRNLPKGLTKLECLFLTGFQTSLMFENKAGAYTGKTLYGDVSGIADEAGKACHASLCGAHPKVTKKIVQ